MSMTMRNFSVWVAGEPPCEAAIVTAETHSKARYSYWLDISDVCDIPYTAMRSRVTCKETKAERLDRECDEWNARTPIGSKVCYWSGLHEGPGVASTTRSLSVVMCDHLSVWVVGYASCISLSHVVVDAAVTT